MTASTSPSAAERIKRELGRNFLVEASAGTGKTTSLVSRVAAVVGTGADIRRMVAVTFTDRAASELKLRIRTELERCRERGGPDKERFKLAAEHLEEAHIATIHRFSSDLLRRYPIQAGLDPQFRVATPEETRRLREEAFERVFDSLLASDEPTLQRLFARPETTLAKLRRAAGQILDYRAFRGHYSEQPLDHELRPAAIAARIRAFCSEARTRPEREQTALLAPSFYDLDHRLSAGTLDEHDLEAHLVALEKDLRKVKVFANRAPAELEAARDVLLALLPRFAQAASADLAAKLRKVLDPVIDHYQQIKQVRGLVDFDDLLLFARDLVSSNAAVRAELRARYTHLFVDEFQDTDRVQAELLLLLAAELDADPKAPFKAPLVPGKLFIVGDPKQSIYRFRNADPATYDLVKAALLAHGGDLVLLSTSYRSTSGITDFVNEVFEPNMVLDDETHQPAYQPLAAVRAAPREQPSILALPVPAPYGAARLSKDAVSKSLPSAVADCVAWLLHSDLRVEDAATGLPRSVSPKDIAILFRQIENYGESRTTAFSEALSARGLAHITLGGAPLAERGEAHALMVAIQAIEDPRDQLQVYASLRGLLFGLTDELLLTWQLRYGALNPLRPPITALPEAMQSVAAALSLLAELHARRNRRSPSQTLQALLDATQLLVAIALTATPAQGFLQIQSIFQRAFEHDRSGGISFRAFAADLADRNLGRQGAADDLDQDDLSGVRLLTVHRAKGLEFPVVILADPETNQDRDPERVIDLERGVAAMELASLKPWDLLRGADQERARGRAESLRCAYVAATRARDLLVVPIVGDELPFPKTGWLSLLAEATLLGPRSKLSDFGFSGKDVVLKRPPSVERAWTLEPGLYQTRSGRQTLVLDPAELAKSVAASQGLSAIDLIAKDADPAKVAEDSARLTLFEQQRGAAAAAAATPSLIAETVTARSASEAASSSREVAILSSNPAARSCGGKRFGTLVHAVLAAVPLSADEATVETMTTTLGRLGNVPAAEVREAARAVTRALACPVFDRARAATRVFRELPLTHIESDGHVIDGVVDLAFEELGRLTVIDFKTDRPERMLPENLARYRLQVSIYADALSRSLGLPTECALLFV
jgi:ATP-dependent helicase/nuclease subunit A